MIVVCYFFVSYLSLFVVSFCCFFWFVFCFLCFCFCVFVVFVVVLFVWFFFVLFFFLYLQQLGIGNQCFHHIDGAIKHLGLLKNNRKKIIQMKTQKFHCAYT